MLRIIYSDKRLVEGLKTEGKSKEVKYMNREFYPMVKNLICRNRGQPADAEDIFQEAMVVMIQKIRNDEFHLSENTKLKTYFFQVCKNQWLKELKKNMEKKQN